MITVKNCKYNPGKHIGYCDCCKLSPRAIRNNVVIGFVKTPDYHIDICTDCATELVSELQLLLTNNLLGIQDE